MLAQVVDDPWDTRPAAGAGAQEHAWVGAWVGARMPCVWGLAMARSCIATRLMTISFTRFVLASVTVALLLGPL